MCSTTLTTIELTPEMTDIVERLRGEMTAQQFLSLLLKIADTPGALSRSPEMISSRNRGA